MMYRVYLHFIFLALPVGAAWGQSESNAREDSLRSVSLQEIVIISTGSAFSNHSKSLSTVDGYLDKISSLSMIRRGSYAWEPFLNGMASERSVITVDGMRIYSACTDKMDPATSYVEITNLAQASVHNGQRGSSGGSTIAGTLDLVRRKSNFGEKKLEGMVFNGFETNNKQTTAGLSMSVVRPRIFTDIDFAYRKAKNYKAGGGQEILYSPFTKFNVSTISGIKIDDHQQIEVSAIYDDASDVGYPALPMDVSQARAFLGSLEYARHVMSPFVEEWKTKIYYNGIVHIMDDKERPDVPIRMDMPGWSKTTGFYSSLTGQVKGHFWKSNLSGHHNNSLAEMTMFSNSPRERDMFMLTWPGVDTYYLDLFLEDAYTVSENLKVTTGGGVALHNNWVGKTSGLESLRIFYPDMSRDNTRLLKRLSSTVQYGVKNWQYAIGAGYGERAPGVSEGYGFYLFNSFDRFDYIGNPQMNNEKSWEFNGSVAYTGTKLSTKLSGSYFRVMDYIIGRPANELSPMTIGANGVKLYEQLKYAQVWNSLLEVQYQWANRWRSEGKIIYRKGSTIGNGNLPLIQPFTYNGTLVYSYRSFSVEAVISGALKQTDYSPEFGETGAPAYNIFNFTLAQRFDLDKQQILLKLGVENLTDRYYSTFADWNRLARMGRNVFMNVVFSL